MTPVGASGSHDSAKGAVMAAAPVAAAALMAPAASGIVPRSSPNSAALSVWG